MATNKELEQRIAQLERALAAATSGAGTQRQPVRLPEKERRDYVPFGSDGHRAFLGLELVDDVEEAKANLFAVYKSPDTGKHYRLVDEMQAVQTMRPMDPDKAILMVLRQKVTAFESGEPQPFPGAPPRFDPERESEFTPLN